MPRSWFFEADFPAKGTVGSAVASYVFDHSMLKFCHRTIGAFEGSSGIKIRRAIVPSKPSVGKYL